MSKELNPGTKCTVNKGRDNFMCGELRPFMGNKCTVIRETRAGLYIIALDSDPKQTESVAKRSLDLWIEPEQTNDQSFKQWLESDEFSQVVDEFITDLAREYQVPLWLIIGKDKEEELLNRVRKSMSKELNPGTKCTVNKGRDNFMCCDLRPFMGTKCTVIRKTKAGLYLISLDADPKKIESVARRSIDLWPVDGHDLTNYEPYE